MRTDPELAAGSRDFDVRDMPAGLGSPFETAAEVWTAHRAGELDARTYGVFPDRSCPDPTSSTATWCSSWPIGWVTNSSCGRVGNDGRR